MAQLRDIKQRIESVKKTQKMTQAMKMVAAAKFNRASDRATQSRPYLRSLEEMVTVASGQAKEDSMSPLFQTQDNPKQAVVVITGDRGLCGGFNTNIIRFAQQYVESID